jgi:hypothetical protein
MPGHGPVGIGQVAYPSVDILFENQTGSIVYITGPRIRNCSPRFPVPITAVKDTGENAYPLSFLNPASQKYEGHQITLQTNDKALSVMPVTTAMPTEFYEYKTPTIRRFSECQNISLWNMLPWSVRRPMPSKPFVDTPPVSFSHTRQLSTFQNPVMRQDYVGAI